MPINFRDAVPLVLLLFCVPLQIIIMNYSGSNEESRTFAISNLITDIEKFYSNWLRVEPWKKWCLHLLGPDTETGPDSPAISEGESPAYEVLKFRSPDGHFGTSTEPRTLRPPYLKYRVGQVIVHKVHGYRGVIIGWDLVANAPESWIQEMHGNNHHWKNQPNYAILVDTRDRALPQLTYVPQENIETTTNTKVLHPSLEEYFEDFDGSQYILRPWLRTIYTRD